jgi:hypothetical protein
MEPWAGTVEQYADFAEHASDSPCFAAWSRAVADDPEVLAWIATLPTVKQQPNLVFAAARWHGVPAPGPYARLRAALLADDGNIRATILARATQTNESGRLATLVPAFARAAAAAGGGPVALLEVGASAGLCLYPDRYSYTWRTGAGLVQTGAGPELTCEVAGAFEGPVAVPRVAWRGGVDLHPLDVTDTDQMAWLATLVWPEHDDRRRSLAAALAVARAEPPRIDTGDLLERLPALVAEAATHGRVVVFHSAVAAYLDDAGRARLDAMLRGLVADGACHWVSNEAPHVLPRVTGDLVPGPGRFVLALDGVPVAVAHGHGHALEWRTPQ